MPSRLEIANARAYVPRPAARQRARRSSIALLAGGILVCAGPAQAQTLSTVTQLLDVVFAPITPFNPLQNPLLSLEEYQRRQQDSREGITIGLGNALASIPLGASSAGFSYVVDTKTGDRVLKSASFGPVFIERALTNGRGVLNLGASFQVASFDRLQGVDLDAGAFPVYGVTGVYTHDGSGVGDSWRSRLSVDSRVFVFSGSYGVTNQFDVGWAVPVASLKVRGQVFHDYNGGWDWENDVPDGPIRRSYIGKVGTFTDVDETVEASGIGDIVVRAKYGFSAGSSQVALVAAELRLPTGDEENLLGTGKSSVRFIAGATKQAGPGSINVNGGYTVGGLTEEINFAAGAEMALLARKQLTIAFDFISQTLRDTVTSLETLESSNFLTGETFPTKPYQRRVIGTYTFWNRGSTTLARAAIGAKYAIANNWLVTATAMFRLNDNGYQPKIVPFVGLEHTWSGR